MGILSELEPKEVFKYFEEICGIPHGSGNTKQISDYLVNFAASNGLRCIQDESNNVILFKDGTSGYENSAPVILQGHMDMVCERDGTQEIDFQTDGLHLQSENGIISAKGTTLGGDDGIAVAYMLAILASTDIPHPPLEAVFTVDEEIGMLGASALDCSPLQSRQMLNLDSEDEGHLLVSCAGGLTATVHIPISYRYLEGKRVLLKIDRLRGGHSGVEIDKGRANACMLLGRALFWLRRNISLQLISVHGGLKDNAIPREASAELLLGTFVSMAEMRYRVNELQEILSKEYRQTDPDVRIQVLEFPTDEEGTKNHYFPFPNAAMNDTSTRQIITALLNLPGGIQKMSHDMEGLVQTSLNLGILSTEKSEVTISFSIRSSLSSEKEALLEKITCLTEYLGGTVTASGDYPAWEYLEHSPLRERMIAIFEKQYGRKPIVESIHAGVECGLFAEKIKGLDCVSFGPDIKNIHTPKEALDIESVKRTWKYLLEILNSLK